jgi:hypothetical protein
MRRRLLAFLSGPVAAQGSRPAGSAEPPAPSSPLVGVPGQARDPPRLAPAHGPPPMDLCLGTERTATGSRPGAAADRATRPGESAVGLPADPRRTAPPWLLDLGQQSAGCCALTASIQHLGVPRPLGDRSYADRHRHPPRPVAPRRAASCSRRRNISVLAADPTIEPTRQHRAPVVRPPGLDLDQTRVQQIESVEEPLDLRAGAGYEGSGGQLI